MFVQKTKKVADKYIQTLLIKKKSCDQIIQSNKCTIQLII